MRLIIRCLRDSGLLWADGTDEQNYFENFEEVHVTAREKEETMTVFDKHLPDVETGKWAASKDYNNQPSSQQGGTESEKNNVL